MEEALRLRRVWAVKGNSSCNHPQLDEEYYWGSQTGEYICTTCGKSLTSNDVEQEHQKRENHPESKEDSPITRQRERFRKSTKNILTKCKKLYTVLARNSINKSNGAS
jgi:hypothetical protein